MTEDELEQIRIDYDGVDEYDVVPRLLADLDRARAVIAGIKKVIFDDAASSHVHRMSRVIHVLQSYDPADSCECFWTEPATWTTHYGAVEPGSQREYNPECPEHGVAIERGDWIG